jgi:hypothetical protein
LKVTFKQPPSWNLFSHQDLLLLDSFDDDHSAEIRALESAHYIYPVDMKAVLRNEDMKNVICRNF